MLIRGSLDDIIKLDLYCIHLAVSFRFNWFVKWGSESIRALFCNGKCDVMVCPSALQIVISRFPHLVAP